MNKYGIEVGDRFLLPSKYVTTRNRPTENDDFAIVKQRYETRVEVFCGPERAVCLLRLDCHRLLSGVYGCRLSKKRHIRRCCLC